MGDELRSTQGSLVVPIVERANVVGVVEHRLHERGIQSAGQRAGGSRHLHDGRTDDSLLERIEPIGFGTDIGEQQAVDEVHGGGFRTHVHRKPDLHLSAAVVGHEIATSDRVAVPNVGVVVLDQNRAGGVCLAEDNIQSGLGGGKDGFEECSVSCREGSAAGSIKDKIDVARGSVDRRQRDIVSSQPKGHRHRERES